MADFSNKPSAWAYALLTSHPAPAIVFLPAAKQILKKKKKGSRYIYDLYYGKEAISKQLYEWLLKNNYADANLIAKWKKQGYEKVCLPRIIHSSVSEISF